MGAIQGDVLNSSSSVSYLRRQITQGSFRFVLFSMEMFH